jgi:hypothetical protein
VNTLRAILFAVAALGLGDGATADDATTEAHFVKWDRTTGKEVPIESARLDDTGICLAVNDDFADDGDHVFELRIYDGGGNEAHISRSTITAEHARWGRRICYGFNESHDVAGTWWYVIDLDGEQLLSKELTVYAR